MSLDNTSEQPKSIKLNSSVKVPGVIAPWHHSNQIPIPLRAGLSGTMMPDGTCTLACADGYHTVTTRELPDGAFASF